MARLLIVDDDVQIRLMLRKVFSRKGYGVLEAADGEDAIHKCQDKIVDMVITDIVMPKKDGLQFINELRNMNVKIKIIAMSGGSLYHTPEELTEIAFNLGANDIFVKPINVNRLLFTVEKLMRLKT